MALYSHLNKKNGGVQLVLWTQSSLLKVKWCDHAGAFHMRVKGQPITEWTAYYEKRYNLEHYT